MLFCKWVWLQWPVHQPVLALFGFPNTGDLAESKSENCYYTCADQRRISGKDCFPLFEDARSCVPGVLLWMHAVWRCMC